MSRKSLSIPENLYDRLAELKDDESWPAFFERVADELESGDSGSEHNPSTVVVENIDEIARAAGDEVENRMKRR